jgi:alkylhydroperoxidase family enzyme
MNLSRRGLLVFAAATGGSGGAAQAGGMQAREAPACPPALEGTGGAADLARAAARDADQQGRPPRIAPLPEDQVPDEVRGEMGKLSAGVGLKAAPPGPVAAFNRTTAKAPELMVAHLTLANYLFRGKLPVRDRELAVLRADWLAKAPFEWGEHVKIFKRLGQGTEAEVARVREGSAAPGWSEHERAVLRAVEELLSDAMVGDETWAVLARRWSEPQLLEFPILVGQYLGVAFLQNSIRVRLMPGNPGLTAQ